MKIHVLTLFPEMFPPVTESSILGRAGEKGILDIDENNSVKAFREKNVSDGSMINAGYMVLEPEIFDYLEDDSTIFERKPLEQVAAKGELMSYCHNGFWQCMDTAREKEMLEKMWSTGNAPWKVWND